MKLCHTLSETSCSVYPRFLYGEENPTVDWLPEADFAEKCLLMGADNFLSLDRWKESLKLLESLDANLCGSPGRTGLWKHDCTLDRGQTRVEDCHSSQPSL